MVDLTKLLSIYEKFGGTNNGPQTVITTSGLSSIMQDRFKSELLKIDIVWDGKDILCTELLSSSPESSSISNTSYSEIKIDDRIENSINSDGIGIDIQTISELPDCLDFWEEQFYRDNFSNPEISYALSKNNPKETFAGIFSLKESLFKADNSLNRSEIEIKHVENKPLFQGFNVSISHSHDTVVSVAYSIGNKGFSQETLKNQVTSNNEVHQAANIKDVAKFPYLRVILLQIIITSIIIGLIQFFPDIINRVSF